MPNEELLQTLKAIQTTLKGLELEVKNRRRHATDSDELVLHLLKDLVKILLRVEKEIGK